MKAIDGHPSHQLVSTLSNLANDARFAICPETTFPSKQASRSNGNALMHCHRLIEPAIQSARRPSSAFRLVMLLYASPR